MPTDSPSSPSPKPEHLAHGMCACAAQEIADLREALRASEASVESLRKERDGLVTRVEALRGMLAGATPTNLGVMLTTDRYNELVTAEMFFGKHAFDSIAVWTKRWKDEKDRGEAARAEATKAAEEERARCVRAVCWLCSGKPRTEAWHGDQECKAAGIHALPAIRAPRQPETPPPIDATRRFVEETFRAAGGAMPSPEGMDQAARQIDAGLAFLRKGSTPATSSPTPPTSPRCGNPNHVEPGACGPACQWEPPTPPSEEPRIKTEGATTYVCCAGHRMGFPCPCPCHVAERYR